MHEGGRRHKEAGKEEKEGDLSSFPGKGIGLGAVNARGGKSTKGGHTTARGKGEGRSLNPPEVKEGKKRRAHLFPSKGVSPVLKKKKRRNHPGFFLKKEED